VTPRKFTISMEATVSGGGVAVPTSASPSKRTGSPRGTGNGGGDANTPVPVSELTELPRLLKQPSQQQMRAAYPEAARRDAVEADVRLRLLVGADGRVSRAKLVKRAGRGFDQVALKLVKQFRFRPGTRGGNPVPTWIPWTYKFRLVD
jgi:protein TonB